MQATDSSKPNPRIRSRTILDPLPIAQAQRLEHIFEYENKIK